MTPRPGAKGDLVFTMPREYAEVLKRAMRNRGLTSFTAYGRMVVLADLQEMELVDKFFRPTEVTEEDTNALRNREGVPV